MKVMVFGFLAALALLLGAGSYVMVSGVSGDAVAVSVMPDSAQQRAEEIALGTVPGGKVAGITLKRDDDELFWQVEVDSPDGLHRTMIIDAGDGRILNQRLRK